MFVRQTNDKGVNELTRAAVGCGLKGNFCDSGYRFFSADCLNGLEDVEWKFCVSYAIRHDFVRPFSPLLVHVGSVHVHFVFLFVVGKKQGGHKREGLAARPERLTCLPPCIHDDAPRQVPCTVALAFGRQRVPLTFQFGFQGGRSAPSEQGRGPFPASATLQDTGAVSQPWEVEVVDVVARNDVGVGGLHRLREPFEDLLLTAPVGKHLSLAGSKMLHTGGCTQHGFVFNAGLQIKGKHRVGNLKRLGGYHVVHIAS